MGTWETMSGHVFRVVSGAPSRTPLTPVQLATAGHTVVFGQADFGRPVWVPCAWGFRPFGHVALNSFLKNGQRGLVDWSRQWLALVSYIRAWGF